jgi:glycosyltransferase involved in cell wall biosynthesis
MRVLHVGNFKPDSANGVNQTIAGLARHLPREGVETELWHFSSKCDRVGQRSEEGVRIIDLPAHSARWLNLLRLPAPTRDYVRSNVAQFDIVHLHSVFSPENLYVGQLSGIYVVTPNGGYSSNVLRGRNRVQKAIWLKVLERPFLRGAAFTHAVSPAEERDLRSLGAGRTVFIPNGIEESLLGRPTTPPGDARGWLFLGRLAVDQKGLDLLVQGYAQARRTRADVLPQLTLAGSDFRNGRAYLENSALDLGITAGVRCVGPVFGEEKWQALASCRLFVHTSRWEGLPFAALEAMASGRPVLVTPETNLADPVRKYEAGWVVDGSPASIAKGLLAAAAAGREELNKMGDRARELVRDQYVWPVVAHEMANLYRAISR